MKSKASFWIEIENEQVPQTEHIAGLFSSLKHTSCSCPALGRALSHAENGPNPVTSPWTIRAISSTHVLLPLLGTISAKVAGWFEGWSHLCQFQQRLFTCTRCMRRPGARYLDSYVYSIPIVLITSSHQFTGLNKII